MGLDISRRAFLIGGVTGLTFGFMIDRPHSRRVRHAIAQNADFKPNVWVTIGPDGTITIVAPAAEMGQGTMTSLPLLVAEELDADWANVKVVQAPSNRAYGNPGFGGIQVTGASRSTPGYFKLLRLAGAQARRVLLDAVAAAWSVPVGELTTEPSVVVHQKSGRKISYGDVAKFARVPAQLPPVTEADLKKPSQFRLIGKNIARLEMPNKVVGQATFGIDSEVPDMLYASVLRWPVQGNGPDTVDDLAAKQVPGVTHVVALPWGVGVVGTGYEAVQKGKAALKVTWKTGAQAETYTTDAVLRDYAAIAANLNKKGLVIYEQGDLTAGVQKSVREFTALYLSDHVYHATMEPMNAVARVSADGTSCELWAPTQAPTLNQLAVSGVLKTTPDKITVHTTFLGGGFGRRLEQDFVVDAVLLSKATGKPVKVVWSREDDVRNDKYRPATAQYLTAGLDAAGNVSTWRHRIVAASIFARFNPNALATMQGKEAPIIDGHDHSYAMGSELHELFREDRGVDVGFWRSVGPGYTKFAIESFIDEIARGQRIDPVQFRMRLLAHQPRAKAALETVAQMADWRRPRRHRALGVAMSDAWRSHIATVAEVSVDRRSGQIRVHKVWAVVDPGIAILPDNIIAQIEGATVFGTSAALQERITVQNGAVQQSNFHDYRLLRMADTPDIEVKVLSSENEPGGIGEVGLPPVAPAIANAVAKLTGARVRSLPMVPERVLTAMKV
jgi:isoquinoline 1-oxidoreductase beta subunit